MPTRRSLLKSLAAISAAGLPPGAWADAPVETPLTDPLRPSFHYLPARNWINDPCGPLYFKGQYHLFHQYNPGSALWGDMHWAHAVSPDMVHWRRLPVALAPTPGGPDSEGCFTGTAAVQDGRPVLLYTGIRNAARNDATLVDDHSAFRESQCLAVAADDTLGEWKKLPAPVIPLPPPGMNVTGFRDPSPWKDGETWYAVVASGIAKRGGMVLLYRSADLRGWEYLHPLLEGQWTGVPGGNPVDTGEMWECPDFFPLTDLATGAAKHVLIYSTEGKVLWRAGTLDRAAMRFEPETAGELDYGRVAGRRVTYYAPKTQLDASGKRILWGWISETRSDAACERAGWSGLISLPRVVTLRAGQLRMEPAAQVGRLRRAGGPGRPGWPVHEFAATLEAGAPVSASERVLADTHGPVVRIETDPKLAANTIHVGSGTPAQQIPIALPEALPAETTLHVFVDNSVLEVFLDGRICYTHRFYDRAADAPVLTLTMAAPRRIGKVETYALENIWPV